MTPDQIVPGVLYGHVNMGVWMNSLLGSVYVVVDADKTMYLQSVVDATRRVAYGHIDETITKLCVPAVPADQRLPEGF